MITLNLLPDIKKQFLKAQRVKRLFMMGSFLVSVAAIGAVVLMAMYVFGVQKLQIINSQGNIDKSIEAINSTPDLDKIVTIQNQLLSLPSLHEGKNAVGNLFAYLKTTTPNDVDLNSVTISFDAHTMEISGTGKDFKSVNTFVDTLKNAGFVYSGSEESKLAFSSVVLGTIGKDRDSSTFRISLSYDPLIFDNTVEGIKITVPDIVSTRSQTEKPKSLFDGDITEDKEESK